MKAGDAIEVEVERVGVLRNPIVVACPSRDTDVKIPAALSVEEGATLPCAALTAWHALVEHGKIAGQTVLLQGTGGVSIFGLQLAHAMGVQVVITSSSDEKLARAKNLGANKGINYKSTPDWEKAAMEFTRGAWRRSGGRGRRCRHADALVRCHPGRWQD